MSKQGHNEERLWTPANVVTLLRICGVPLFVVALISPWPRWFNLPDLIVWKGWIALAFFIILAATDGLDGYLARSRGEITNFGKFVDPLADKVLVAAALLAFIELDVLPSWVALVILSREFIVSGIRMLAATQGVVIAASWYGKIKTLAQIVAIALFIIKDNRMVSDFSEVLSDQLYLISWAVMILALVLTIASLLDYFAKARHLLGFGSRTKNQSVADEASQTVSQETKFLLKDTSYELAEEIITRARARKLMLGVAESCTGGMICARLTDIAGSSDVVVGGIVSYSNDVKRSQLQVEKETLVSQGAVSEKTACEMAKGALETLSVDVAISVTGIAGPGGGSPDKPVGTVWIGISDRRKVSASCYTFDGNREDIRLQATETALVLLRNALVY